MTRLYMLDTNTVRQAVSGRSPSAVARIAELPAGILCVSVITYGESMFGEKRRPEAVAIARANSRFYAEAEILPFTQKAADTYGALRADMERVGLPLGSLDTQPNLRLLDLGMGRGPRNRDEGEYQ